jgi:hypothetical protein
MTAKNGQRRRRGQGQGQRQRQMRIQSVSTGHPVKLRCFGRDDVAEGAGAGLGLLWVVSGLGFDPSKMVTARLRMMEPDRWYRPCAMG